VCIYIYIYANFNINKIMLYVLLYFLNGNYGLCLKLERNFKIKLKKVISVLLK
jgi:hypothetical protein